MSYETIKQGFLEKEGESTGGTVVSRWRRRFFVIEVANQGGLVMPVILDLEFTDGSHEALRIPAEIWRSNDPSVKKLVISEKNLARVELDPNRETADADLSDNVWPPGMEERTIRLKPEVRRGSGPSSGATVRGGFCRVPACRSAGAWRRMRMCSGRLRSGVSGMPRPSSGETASISPPRLRRRCRNLM